MKNKIVIWNENKYGCYIKRDVIKLYSQNKLIFNYELNSIPIFTGDYPCVILNGVSYEVYDNIIDADKDFNILIVYPI